jgi:hypothetical protein
MLTSESSLKSISTASEAEIGSSPEMARQQRLMQAMKADQQEKYLHLQEETESLLQQLQELKRQRQAVDTRELVGALAK